MNVRFALLWTLMVGCSFAASPSKVDVASADTAPGDGVDVAWALDDTAPFADAGDGTIDVRAPPPDARRDASPPDAAADTLPLDVPPPDVWPGPIPLAEVCDPAGAATVTLSPDGHFRGAIDLRPGIALEPLGCVRCDMPSWRVVRFTVPLAMRLVAQASPEILPTTLRMRVSTACDGGVTLGDAEMTLSDSTRVITPMLAPGTEVVLTIQTFRSPSARVYLDPLGALPVDTPCAGTEGLCAPALTCYGRYNHFDSQRHYFCRDRGVLGGACPCDPGLVCDVVDYNTACLPGRAAHEGCSEGTRCAEGLTCAPSDRGGVCVAPAGSPEGACRASATPCDAGLSCLAEAHLAEGTSFLCRHVDLVTAAPGELGGACRSDGSCAHGGCSLGACRLTLPEGSACDFSGMLSCAPSASCEWVGGAVGSVCVTGAPRGAACAVDADCLPRLWCERGQCVPRAECVASRPRCGASASCVARSTGLECVADGALAGICRSTGTPCDLGLACAPRDATTDDPAPPSRCLVPARVGEVCDGSHGCGADARCDVYRARCEARGVVGGPCRDAPPFCDEGAVCNGRGRCEVAAVRVDPVAISAWIDACDGGVRGPSVWNARITWPMELPFEVRMFGATARRVWVSQDGHFDLGADPASGPRVGFALLMPVRLWAAAPFWDTLRPRTVESAVCSKVVGAAGARVAVVEWLDVQSSYSAGSRLTMEAQLGEADGSLRLLYQTVVVGRALRLPDAYFTAGDIGLGSGGWAIPQGAVRSGLGVAFTPR